MATTPMATDALGYVTSYEHNFRGEATKKTDALGGVTTFSYSGCSSCGGGGEKLTSLTDPVGSTTSFSYDLRGLMASRTDPLGKVASFTHDANGRLAGRVDRNEHAVAYTRDAAGRVTRIDYPDGSSVAYEYDELGRLTEMRDAVTTTTYSYDEAGRVTGVSDADGFAIGYAYDAAGNITQITYPDGSAATYAYDALSRLTSVTASQGESTSYSYDAAGRLASFANFDEIATTHTHDAAGGLTGVSSVVASYFFTRDGNGRIAHTIETEPLSPSPTAGSTQYSYNDKKNRLLSAGAVAYGYDDEGQLTSAGFAAYGYDYEHRLAAIGSDARFEYDGRGNRLRATRGGVVTRYIYDPWGNLLAEADGNGNITRTYIYGYGLLAMRTSGGDLYCYHFNATGSTIALTDPTGGIVNSYAYYPFGNVLSQQESISQPFKFVGQYGVMAEANDSLYYMRARYYDPRVGRFISEDPIGFAGGDVNLYGYVLNDPINGIDPAGLVRIKVGGKIYDYHPNDHHGVNPPETHVHDVETGNKIGIETGNIYDPKGKTACGSIGKKDLARLRKTMRAMELIGIVLVAYETYGVITATDAHAFENLLDFLEVFPPDRREKIIKDIIQQNPDKFKEVNE